MSDQTQSLLIWDGDCGFCQNAVRWMLHHDSSGRFKAVPYQHLPDPLLTPALRLKAERAVQVITSDGRQLSAGNAMLFVLQQVGWQPSLMHLAQQPPLIWMVEMGYFVIARNRNFFSRILFHSDCTPE